jgi:hypothetical protein
MIKSIVNETWLIDKSAMWRHANYVNSITLRRRSSIEFDGLTWLARNENGKAYCTGLAFGTRQ